MKITIPSLVEGVNLVMSKNYSNESRIVLHFKDREIELDKQEVVGCIIMGLKMTCELDIYHDSHNTYCSDEKLILEITDGESNYIYSDTTIKFILEGSESISISRSTFTSLMMLFNMGGGSSVL